MSLIPAALRICTVMALRGGTYASGRVYDSVIDAIDTTLMEDRSPVVIVYTDDEELDVSGKDILGASRRLDLVIEYAIASKINASTSEQPLYQVVIPHTDGGMELALGIMGRQIMRSLLTDRTPWSDLWRTMVTSIKKIAIRRGASSEKGVRYAARQFIMTLDALAEPYFGYSVSSGDFWERLLSLMQNSSDLQHLVPILRDAIEKPEITSYEAVAAALGVSRSVPAKIGIPGYIPMGNPYNNQDIAPPFSGVIFGGVYYDENDIENNSG